VEQSVRAVGSKSRDEISNSYQIIFETLTKRVPRRRRVPLSAAFAFIYKRRTGLAPAFARSVEADVGKRISELSTQGLIEINARLSTAVAGDAERPGEESLN
jgi:hypothetical protein